MILKALPFPPSIVYQGKKEIKIKEKRTNARKAK